MACYPMLEKIYHYTVADTKRIIKNLGEAVLEFFVIKSPKFQTFQAGFFLLRILHRAIQIVFLAPFMILILTGRPHFCMGLYLIAVIASFLLGRIYCGWVCPIYTISGSITWIKNRFRFYTFKMPRFLTNTKARFLFLAVFLTILALIIATGRKLPVLLFLFVAGSVLIFLFPEELGHRYLCPCGDILSLSELKPRKSQTINPSQCSNCGPASVFVRPGL